MNAPRVSIIVPNYNHAQFLERRIESILAQTLQDFELILLDDASTDNSREILCRYAADPRVRTELNARNSGSPFVQWNRGLEMASGEYIWIAESDDFSEREFLQELVATLDAHPSAGLAYSQSWIVSETGEKLKVLDWYHVFGGAERWSRGFVNSGSDEVMRFLAIQNTIPNASAVLIRKAALQPDLRAPEHLKLCGDWLFWVQILAHSDVAYVARPLNCFRRAHGQSQRNARSHEGLEAIESLAIQRAVLSRFPTQRREVRRMFNHHVRRWASIAFRERLPRSFDRDMRQHFRDVYAAAEFSGFADRLRLWIFYHLIIPGMRTWLYRNTVGAWRTAYLKRTGVL